jgi:uncharacterized NAD-dependent epimerase/dehydratase family protein
MFSSSPPLPGAIVYCQDRYRTSDGKTAHGLVRYSRRFRVLAVIDRSCAGEDAGFLLDGEHRGIPCLDSLETALRMFGREANWLVVGLAPDGGRLPAEARGSVALALSSGLDVACGLHDFLSDDEALATLAARHGRMLLDVRKPPPRDRLHFFSGAIEQVAACKVAVLGTDSAVGKQTTAWLLVQALVRQGVPSVMVGTGQTAWMQGVRYGLVLDSLVNDFVAGEVEHAVCQAWESEHPRAIVIEGQGSLLHPAYPGGLEILAAARPEAVVLQHAPGRTMHDGFPSYPVRPLPDHIRAVECLSGRPVAAITVNREGIAPDDVPQTLAEIRRTTGVPAFDPLADRGDALADWLRRHWLVSEKDRPKPATDTFSSVG